MSNYANGNFGYIEVNSRDFGEACDIDIKYKGDGKNIEFEGTFKVIKVFNVAKGIKYLPNSQIDLIAWLTDKNDIKKEGRVVLSNIVLEIEEMFKSIAENKAVRFKAFSHRFEPMISSSTST